jgi:uncharacterized protein YqkB
MIKEKLSIGMHKNEKQKETCCVCAQAGVTYAHVKDKAICIQEGQTNHTFQNIIPMCYSCHYEYFDQHKMGIKKIPGKKDLFIWLDKENNIQITEAKCIINIRDEYIKWKNNQCVPKLRIYMLRHTLN